MKYEYGIVIPLYKSLDNLSPLLERLDSYFALYGNKLQIVFVDDGCPQGSFLFLKSKLELMRYNYKLIKLSRNFGAFTAIRAGLKNCDAQYVAVMAADLQEPRELVEDIFKKLSAGHDVVFGCRKKRNDSFFTNLFSNIFWRFYRKFVIRDIPKGGIDIFGINFKVNTELSTFTEQNASLIGILFWIGYDREYVFYERQVRAIGKSSWSLAKKINYFYDSIFAFSDLPLRLLLYVGVLGMCLSFFMAVVVIISKLTGLITVSGYAAVVCVVLFFTFFQSFSFGLIGSYLSRIYDNSKGRPLFLIAEKEVSNTGSDE